MQIWHCCAGEIVISNPNANIYLSYVGPLDPRSGLYVSTPNAIKLDSSNLELASPQEAVSSRLAADICIMAAKLSYENPVIVKLKVKHNWRMHLVKLYKCSNGKASQANLPLQHPFWVGRKSWTRYSVGSNWLQSTST